LILDRGDYLIRVPILTKNEKLAEEGYELGRHRGFGVALHGFCVLEKRVCCYIQLPENDLDSQYKLMSDIYVKYSMVDPIQRGKAIKNPIQWSIRRWQNKRIQKNSFIEEKPRKKTLLAVYKGNGV
jgi:hypothetical protein